MAAENDPYVKTRFPRVIGGVLSLTRYQGPSAAGGGELRLSCLPGPRCKGLHFTVHRLGDPGRQRESQREAAGNYHRHRPISNKRCIQRREIDMQMRLLCLSLPRARTFAVCINKSRCV